MRFVRETCLLALLFVSLPVGIGRSTSTGDEVSEDGWSCEIPITLHANRVILPVTVGDSRVFRVILDTGMPLEGLLLYDGALADTLGMEHQVPVSVGGAGPGGRQVGVMSDSMSFQIGSLRLSNQTVVILQSDVLRGFPSDGVCGLSLFGRYSVEIDYDRMMVVLRTPGGFSPDSSWTSVPLTFKAGEIPWVDLQIGVDGVDSVSASCYIDLASRETLELLTRETMALRIPEDWQTVYLGRGLSGDIYGTQGRVAWVRLGSFRLHDVLIAAVDAEVRSRQPGADAVVGNGLLRNFNCVFEYHAGRLYLKPNRDN